MYILNTQLEFINQNVISFCIYLKYLKFKILTKKSIEVAENV